MNKLLITIFILFLYSCRISARKNEPDRDSQEVYNLALDNTTGSDTAVRRHLRIPPTPLQLYGDKVSKSEITKYAKWQDSFRLVLDTLQLFVVVEHKLSLLQSIDVRDIIQTIDFDRKKDTSFNVTIRELYNKRLDFDSIDISKLKTRFNYRIYSDRFFPKDKQRQIGTINFSKVAFSKNKSKAAVYTSFICGRLCGTGQILFFERVNGIWQYIKSWELWIS